MDKGIDYEKVAAQIERLYSVYTPVDRSDKHDPVCTLNDTKKRSLCEFIFTLDYHRSRKIVLNKASLYLQKLSCEEKELVFLYISNNDVKLKQKMYNCPGRNHIVRTSFIEDNYYENIYLSAGHHKNSVMVYTMTYESEDHNDKIIVFDYILNVDFSQLGDLIITLKDVTTELALQKQIIFTKINEELEMFYIREQKYLNVHSDSICDLEYEKKISLCNIVLNNYMFGRFSDLVLNKAAVYLYSMKCVTRPIRKFVQDHKLLKKEQKLYPCYGRHKISTAANYLLDDFIKVIYLSSSPKKNSVLVYACVYYSKLGSIFILMGIVENINLRILQATTVTLEEIRMESELTYAAVLNATQTVKIMNDNYITDIVVRSVGNNLSDREELVLIDDLILRLEKYWQKYYEIMLLRNNEAADSSKSKLRVNKEQSEGENKILNSDCENKKQLVSQDEDVLPAEHCTVGPQLFKSLIEEKKQETLGKKVGKSIKFTKRNRKCDIKVQKLIKKMKQFVQELFKKRTEHNDLSITIDEISSGSDKLAEDKKKYAKTKKKKEKECSK